MRQIFWVVLGLAVISPVIFWYQGSRQPKTDTLEGAGIRLTNRPTAFCPEKAKVVAVKTGRAESIHFDGEAVIAGCDAIRLPTDQLNEAVEYQIFVSIDGARAFRAIASGPIEAYLSFPIQVGDTNSDNVINEVDLRGVQAALGKIDAEAGRFDVDGDKEVTILDYSLVITNQGAGVSRPDGKLWGAV